MAAQEYWDGAGVAKVYSLAERKPFQYPGFAYKYVYIKALDFLLKFQVKYLPLTKRNYVCVS